MKHTFIKADHSETVILFFAGWGFSPTFLEDMDNGVYSVLILYDYRDISEENMAQIRSILDEFSTIHLVAWSFGVFYADYLFDRIFTAEKILPTKLLAINGSLCPIDAQYGIPEHIFQGTLDGLDGRNLQKFYLRIAGSRAIKQTYLEREAMDVDVLKDELSAIQRRANGVDIESFQNKQAVGNRCKWTNIYLSTEDGIFPYANLSRFWDRASSFIPIHILSESGSHFPFYKWQSWGNLIENTFTNSGSIHKKELYND